MDKSKSPVFITPHGSSFFMVDVRRTMVRYGVDATGGPEKYVAIVFADGRETAFSGQVCEDFLAAHRVYIAASRLAECERMSHEEETTS